MVLEFCHKGALYDVLQTEKHEDISWFRVLRAAIDTVKGLLCLHSWKPPIVHRDLKTLNLLVRIINQSITASSSSSCSRARALSLSLFRSH